MTVQATIPVNEPLLDGNEERYLIECIRTGWISSEGPFVHRLEEGFAARIGRRHGIAVCNGSVALDVAVAALGLGPGDEVILPSFTIISCAAAVIRAGATPVLVDCEPDTWNTAADGIADRITPRTKAIMIVHIYGLPVDMDPVLELARQHGLTIIEDAAEMHGQTYKGRPCGSFGDISTFSFYANKHVTTGEGGMVVTDDATLAERCRSLRNLCFQPSRRFVHADLGWNYRLTNLQAALGLAQLERLDELVDKKRQILDWYRQELHDFPWITLNAEPDGVRNSYWMATAILPARPENEKENIIRRFSENGIDCRPFFYPLSTIPAYSALPAAAVARQEHRQSHQISRYGINLPCALRLEEEDVRTVARVLRSVATAP